jgi:hypothetical protein
MGVKLDASHLGGEHRLGVFENRVLRRIFGPQTETSERESDRRMEKIAI